LNFEMATKNEERGRAHRVKATPRGWSARGLGGGKKKIYQIASRKCVEYLLGVRSKKKTKDQRQAVILEGGMRKTNRWPIENLPISYPGGEEIERWAP